MQTTQFSWFLLAIVVFNYDGQESKQFLLTVLCRRIQWLEVEQNGHRSRMDLRYIFTQNSDILQLHCIKIANGDIFHTNEFFLEKDCFFVNTFASDVIIWNAN